MCASSVCGSQFLKREYEYEKSGYIHAHTHGNFQTTQYYALTRIPCVLDFFFAHYVHFVWHGSASGNVHVLDQ